VVKERKVDGKIGVAGRREGFLIEDLNGKRLKERLAATIYTGIREWATQ